MNRSKPPRTISPLGSPEAGFLEEISLFLAESGMPRMAGRILGRLLVCAPEYQSAAELARSLRASKGSISTMTRLLISAGLVERLGVPGRREAFFRIRPGAWPWLLGQQLDRVTAVRRLADRGLEILPGEASEQRRRLEEMRDLFAEVEEALPALVARCGGARTPAAHEGAAGG